jgi:3'(2'), 5'-bisphosphate nucleotidase
MNIADTWADVQQAVLPLFEMYRRDLRHLSIATKHDHTLLTEADTAVQHAIVDCILRRDPSAAVVAEEQQTLPGPTAERSRIYVIDPIDGTAEFVHPERREFCSVVCLLVDRRPTATLVVAPELGPGRSPVTIAVTDANSGQVTVDGRPACLPPPNAPYASVTRSRSAEPFPIESRLRASGFKIKTRTTSQTLDMTRAAVDLSSHTDMHLPSFGIFIRHNQKVWDGAAGMCLSLTSKKSVTNGRGIPRETIDLDLSASEPTFPLTVAGDPYVVQRFAG